MDTPRHVRVGEEETTNFNLFKNLCYSPLGHEELFIELHDHLPPEIIYERELLICRLY